MRNTWIFQYNTKIFDLIPYIEKDYYSDKNGPYWNAAQYRHSINVGDEIFFWKTQPQGGIYAIGEVVSKPYQFPLANQYLVDVKLNYRLISPILRNKLYNDPIFENLSIFKNPRGTNFPVTTAERQAFWEIINCEGYSEIIQPEIFNR